MHHFPLTDMTCFIQSAAAQVSSYMIISKTHVYPTVFHLCYLFLMCHSCVIMYCTSCIQYIVNLDVYRCKYKNKLPKKSPYSVYYLKEIIKLYILQEMNLKSTRFCPGVHNLLIWKNWTQVIYLVLSSGGQQHPATYRLQRNLYF